MHIIYSSYIPCHFNSHLNTNMKSKLSRVALSILEAAPQPLTQAGFLLIYNKLPSHIFPLELLLNGETDVYAVTMARGGL